MGHYTLGVGAWHIGAVRQLQEFLEQGWLDLVRLQDERCLQSQVLFHMRLLSQVLLPLFNTSIFVLANFCKFGVLRILQVE